MNTAVNKEYAYIGNLFKRLRVWALLVLFAISNMVVNVNTVYADSEYSSYVGKLAIAAYCDSYKTYKGGDPTSGKTVAAKLKMFDIGENIKIGDKVYTVESVLSENSENDIMIYFDSKSSAYDYGMKKADVYRKPRGSSSSNSSSSSGSSKSSSSSSGSSKKAVSTKLSSNKGKSLGTFTTTGYCNCSICAGAYAGRATSSGVMPKANHTIAADPSVLPIGTRVIINGQEYKVEDTGSGVNGNKIDIYYDNHDAAMAHGNKKVEVFAVN